MKSLRSIVQAVTAQTGGDPKLVFSSLKTEEVSRDRAIIAYLCHVELRWNFSRIDKKLKRANGSTRRMVERVAESEDYEPSLFALLARIRGI